MALTNRQLRFIEEYPRDFNAAKAAIRAGYSEKTAKEIGYENLTKPHIKDAISERLDRLTMQADEALLRLTQWGRGTLEPFINTSEDGSFSLTLGSDSAKANLHLLKKVKQTKTVVRGKDEYEREEVRTEIEIHDAKDAVIQMAKIRGQYVDRVDSRNLTIDLNECTDDELSRIAAGEDIASVLASTRIGVARIEAT